MKESAQSKSSTPYESSITRLPAKLNSKRAPNYLRTGYRNRVAMMRGKSHPEVLDGSKAQAGLTV